LGGNLCRSSGVGCGGTLFPMRIAPIPSPAPLSLLSPLPFSCTAKLLASRLNNPANRDSCRRRLLSTISVGGWADACLPVHYFTDRPSERLIFCRLIITLADGGGNSIGSCIRSGQNLVCDADLTPWHQEQSSTICICVPDVHLRASRHSLECIICPQSRGSGPSTLNVIPPDILVTIRLTVLSVISSAPYHAVD
jgi:hypothetical protein